MQTIKDRWAAGMQAVRKVKPPDTSYPVPNADGVPEQVLQSQAGLPVRNS